MCGGCESMCGKCSAGKKVIFGALVVANAYFGPWIAPGTDALTNWIAFFAVLYIIKGVLKFIMPACPHCKAEMPSKKGK